MIVEYTTNSTDWSNNISEFVQQIGGTVLLNHQSMGDKMWTLLRDTIRLNRVLSKKNFKNAHHDQK